MIATAAPVEAVPQQRRHCWVSWLTKRAAFEKCYAECLRRNMARAVGAEVIEAECRRGCTR